MKIQLFFLLCIYGLSAFQSNSEIAGRGSVTCILSSERAVYHRGETPKLQVLLVNNTRRSIYLPGALDGSEIKWRMPWCWFAVEKPVADTITVSRCRTLNPLRTADFVLLKPGDSLNPFQKIDAGGFSVPYEINQPETFRHPGVYKIQFHYVTASDRVADFLGNGQWYGADSSRIKKLFAKMPRLRLASNVLEIEILP